MWGEDIIKVINRILLFRVFVEGTSFSFTVKVSRLKLKRVTGQAQGYRDACPAVNRCAATVVSKTLGTVLADEIGCLNLAWRVESSGNDRLFEISIGRQCLSSS